MSTSGQGGAIINVASVTGLMGEQARPAYTAAKHGVLGLTKTLASDLAKYGIRVNAICPGLIRTPLTEPYFASPAFADGLKASIPLGTYGEPRQIAAAAVFLASAQADYITGIALPVDGGSPAFLRIHPHGAPIPGLPHPDNARRKGRHDGARARFRIRSRKSPVRPGR
jgi:NAD(P)-dependent dehydrogenase (short-subunit alcohol dehydrogenase family)